MRLRDVMSDEVITIGPEDTASDALAVMRRRGIRHLAVVEEGRLVGVIAAHDLEDASVTASGGEVRVRDRMATDPVSASSATSLRHAANLMRGRSIGSLVVVDDGRVVGIVTTTDLLDRLGRGATRQTVRRARPATRSAGRASAAGRRSPTREPERARQSRRAVPARVALPSALPRQAKLVRGRTGEIPPPGHIRVLGATVPEQERDKIARKLGQKLAKFASSIERVSVRLSDVNGPKGGVDHKCLIKVVLSGLPSVVVERQDSVPQRAVNEAIDATTVAVRRRVQRRRLKPLQRRRPRRTVSGA